MILDTTFLIDVLRGADAAREHERRLDEQGTPLVTAISVMELVDGAERSGRTDREREQIRTLLEGLTLAPFDRPSAVRAGELEAQLAQRGERIGVSDVIIAAIALERDDAVLTRNAEHFERIDGLDVETY